jgi:NADP-dependent 3-hydroxy acid dehydrogenase YdfG
VLVQIVVADETFAGLSALLKTAALENPNFVGQLIHVPAGMEAEELSGILEAEKRGGIEPLVRYEHGARNIQRWHEVPHQDDVQIPLRDRGVYLITGGTGRLGTLFANEILAQTPAAGVVLAGRGPLAGARFDARVGYRQVDLADLEQVRRLIASVHDEYGRLDGILHIAGMNADNSIVKKTAAEFSQVLMPKVTGTFHLDQATQDVDLDFFVLFSSIASATGNAGQADYAAANGFMDQFAASRNRQVAAQQRHGRTRSINWSLWQAGGMHVDPATLELVRQTTGIQSLQTANGLSAFHRSLALPHDQLLVVEARCRNDDFLQTARLFEPSAITPVKRPATAPPPLSTSCSSRSNGC